MMEVREGVIGKKSLRMKGRGEMRRVGLTIDWRRKWRMLREGERWERGEESETRVGRLNAGSGNHSKGQSIMKSDVFREWESGMGNGLVHRMQGKGLRESGKRKSEREREHVEIELNWSRNGVRSKGIYHS